MGNIFRQRLDTVSRDQVIDRRDLQDLKTALQASKEVAPNSQDVHTGEHLMGFLDTFKTTTHIRYTVQDHSQPVLYSFALTPNYSEADAVPGQTPEEQVAHLSQNDSLPETNADNSRCGAASLLNVWLLTGGRFEDAARRFGLPSTQHSLTYGNAHRLQEAIYNSVNRDGVAGLTTQLSYTHRDGQLVTTQFGGEITAAAEILGLKIFPLTGTTTHTLHERKAAVDTFLNQNYRGALLVGVHLDQSSGELLSVNANRPQNHFVTAYRRNGTYTLVDTGASDNGARNSSRTLDRKQIDALIMQGQGHVVGLAR